MPSARPPRRRRGRGSCSSAVPGPLRLLVLWVGLLFFFMVVGCCRAQTAPEAVKDFYAVLSVDETASAAEIKKQYKKLALQYHPDKNPEDKELATQKFAEVAQAYEVLGNAERRQEYDRARKMAAAGGGGGGMHGMHGHFYDHGGDGGGGDEWTFEWEGGEWDWSGGGGGGPFDFQWQFSDPFDIFTSMFGGGADMFGGMGGMDIYYDEDTGEYMYMHPSGGAGDPHAVVYEVEERTVDPATGIEYVRVERVFGDGRTEVQALELPPYEPVMPPQPPPPRRRPPPSSFVEPPLEQGLGRLGGVRNELVAGEAPLKEGKKLVSSDGSYACFIDTVRRRLVVAGEGGRGRIVWEAPEEGEEEEGDDGMEWNNGGSSSRRGGMGMGQFGEQLEAVVTRDGRLELHALQQHGRKGGQQRTVLWRSAREEDGGADQGEDAFVSGFQYVLTLEGRDGNLVLRSIPTAKVSLAPDEKEEEGEEEECVWASRGCPGRGLEQLQEARALLQAFGRRVVSPLFRHARAAARAVHAGLKRFGREHGPGIVKGARRLQGMLKKAGKRLTEAIGRKAEGVKERRKRAAKEGRRV